METNTPQRYGGLLGVLGGALALGGTFAATAVDFTPEAGEAVASFVDDRSRILGGAQILVIGAVLLAAFGAVLHRHLRRASPSSALPRAAATGYGGAAVAASLGASVLAAGALRGDTDSGIVPAEATTLFDIGYVFLGAAMPVFLALGVGATAIASIQNRTGIPPWLAWIGVPIALGAMALPINWIVGPIALGWTIVAGVMLSSSSGSVVDVTVDSFPETAPA